MSSQDRILESVPKSVPVTTTRFRPPKKNIPQTKARTGCPAAARCAITSRQHNPVPPMPLDELDVHARIRFIAETGTPELYLHYTAVVLNNEMWRETLASIPYERRLLLMPKCLRIEDKCPAPFDEFGLLCKQCGLCTIRGLPERGRAPRLRRAGRGGLRRRHVAYSDRQDRGHRRHQSCLRRVGANVPLRRGCRHPVESPFRCCRTTASTPPSTTTGCGITFI